MMEHGDDLMTVIVERTKPNKGFAQRMDVVSLVRSVEGKRCKDVAQLLVK